MYVRVKCIENSVKEKDLVCSLTQVRAHYTRKRRQIDDSENMAVTS